MKRISDKRAAGGFGVERSLWENGTSLVKSAAVILALSFSISAVAAQEPSGQEGSLEELWQDQQPKQEAKPSDEASADSDSTKKSKSKSKKSKSKKKAEPDAPAEGDLKKAPDSPSWESPTQSSPPATTPGSSTPPSQTSPSSSSTSSPSATTSTSGSSSSGFSTTPSGSSSALSRPVTLGSGSSSGITSPTKSTGSALSTPVTLGGGSSTVTTSPTTSSDSTTPASSVSSTSTNTDGGVAFSSPSSGSATSTKTSSSQESSGSGDSQPLCKLNTLTNSDLIKAGGWPGIGPFAQDKNNTDVLTDESKNQLKMKLSGEDVTHAELLLVNQSPKPSQLLALQMTANFLLEAVGAQAGKIADFNSAMQHNQDKITGTDTPISLKAGTYVVHIQKQPAQEATVPGNVSYLIALDNQKPAPAPPTTTPPSTTSIHHTPTTHHTPHTSSPALSTPIKLSSTPPAVTLPPKPKDELLHRQFANLIQQWQGLKRAAVKSRQTGSLTRILGGNALATQNKAIAWLLEKRKYYEMTPIQLQVQNYKEVLPGSKYEVDAFIKERQQLVNADTMKPEKDNVQAYNVVYTVEKIRGTWLITDTRVVKPQ